MKKTRLLIAAIIMGTAGLGMGQDITRANLRIDSNTDHSFTLTVTAGSQQTYAGWDLVWFDRTGVRHIVTYDAFACPQYNLMPGQSVQITLDPSEGSNACDTYLDNAQMECQTAYRITGNLRGLGTRMTVVSAVTSPCE